MNIHTAARDTISSTPLKRLSLKVVAPLTLYWLLFSVSIFAFTLNYFVQAWLPLLGVILGIMGCVSCGLSWLLVRELFSNATPRAHWPLYIVGALFVFSALLIVAESFSDVVSGSDFAAFYRQVITLLSSTVLLLPLVEALEGYRRLESKREQHFRLIFLVGYIFLLASSIVATLPAFEQAQGGAKASLAAFALVGAGLAVGYRRLHPLEATIISRKSHRGTSATTSDPAVTAKLREQLDEHKVFLNTELKVADLALLMAEQEYKVTQSITGALGYRNFNHMLNSYRIEQAKKLLTSPEYASRAILVIAMDCGFGSIGPFNRAFKELVGATPSAYRKEQLSIYNAAS